ncbi:protein-export chaperone SecB [Marinococcus luteus]|uniref:protein-export chaperone SecB n=1 Tax=Marinococcus luteus TaxID=1122204 RepID=UPI002ACCA711|nr:protein-export chaperone SecB [Marinococcus luteus]MDZ5782124.1 protein-export chaperone SecB [Marinococcus luteus]
MQADLEFKKFRIKNLNYNVIDEEVEEGKRGKIDIRFNVGSSDVEISEEIEGVRKKTSTLSLGVEVKAYKKQTILDLDITIEGIFLTDLEIKDEELHSLVKTNGSAIVMPYIRNIISMVTGYDNTYNQVLLPAFDTHKMFDDFKNFSEDDS